MPFNPLLEATPENVIVAGDWHGNTAWARYVIREAAIALEDEPIKIILHTGDFSVWPGTAGAWDLNERLMECSNQKVYVVFVEGNHEWPEGLKNLEIGKADSRILWIPRGYRWEWYDRIWLGLGGAVSLDKSRRTEGVDWWPEEEITVMDALSIEIDGHADVMLTHECPAGVVHAFPPPPPVFHEVDIARSHRHAALLQGIVDTVQPSHLIHGHLHIPYQRISDFGYGPVEVTGLDCDGGLPNYIKLNVRSMEWETIQS